MLAAACTRWTRVGLKRALQEERLVPDPITIRPATPADADAIADVWLASFKAT